LVSNGVSGDGEVAAPRSFSHRYGMPSYREEKDYKYDTVLGVYHLTSVKQKQHVRGGSPG
jgi:hypothetical protein